MRANQILRILHLGRSSKFQRMETMWNLLKDLSFFLCVGEGEF